MRHCKCPVADAASPGLDHRYQAEGPDSLRSVALGELTALYHRRSGVTHVVSAPVPEILDMLQAAPLTVRELLATHDLTSEEDAAAALTARLEELVATGLVARL
jgi:PqqD family protein of HPr-rel-A system